MSEEVAPISVVMPCYCCEKTIERALESIFKQVRQPAEIILVDDASPDRTWLILCDIQRRYPDVIKTVRLSKNLGAANARNIGWSMASQPYIAFLDSDDAWHPKKISVQFSYMNAHPEVALTGHGFITLKDGDPINWWVDTFCARSVNKSELLIGNRFVTPSVMLRREIDLRFVAHQRYMEDHMLWLELALSGAKFKHLDIALVAIYKPLYGVGGLSANLWSMEAAELGNYWRLHRLGHLRWGQLLFFWIFSILKYIRRLIIYGFYLRWL